MQVLCHLAKLSQTYLLKSKHDLQRVLLSRPAAPASLGNLSEMQTLRPTPDPLQLKLWERGSAVCFSKLYSDSNAQQSLLHGRHFSGSLSKFSLTIVQALNPVLTDRPEIPRRLSEL